MPKPRLRRRTVHWATLAFDSMMLMAEAQQVIALRLARLALGGPAAARESRRMVEEKAAAAVEQGLRLAAGAGPGAVVKAYRAKTRANRRRLTGGGAGRPARSRKG